MRAEIIAIGDELVTGQRLDTNSQWLSSELGLLGIPVHFHTTVCDTLEAGIDAFRIAAARCDLVVATGGLGPTADDLTRDVLAAVAGQPLELSAAALEAVKAQGWQVIDEVPRPGSRGTTVAFVHPKTALGTLIEMREPSLP